MSGGGHSMRGGCRVSGGAQVEHQQAAATTGAPPTAATAGSARAQFRHGPTTTNSPTKNTIRSTALPQPAERPAPHHTDWHQCSITSKPPPTPLRSDFPPSQQSRRPNTCHAPQLTLNLNNNLSSLPPPITSHPPHYLPASINLVDAEEQRLVAVRYLQAAQHSTAQSNNVTGEVHASSE